jgi:hypothetical protein
VEFMYAFWSAATALDPAAADISEDKRSPFCTREGLIDLARSAGLTAGGSHLDRGGDGLLAPIYLGCGPAPGYCVSLAPEARQRLKQILQEDLPRRADGSIHSKARALAVRATSD